MIHSTASTTDLAIADLPGDAGRWVVYHRLPNTPAMTPWTLQLGGTIFTSYQAAGAQLRPHGLIKGNGCHACIFAIAPGVIPPRTLDAEVGLNILYHQDGRRRIEATDGGHA